MSNIEQILSKCDNCKLNECDGCITYSDMQVIKARIKELEEENRMLALEGSRVRLDLYIKQNYIPKQKVKDVLQNNRNEIFSFTYVDDEQFKPYTMQIDRINKIEKELLEEGE